VIVLAVTCFALLVLYVSLFSFCVVKHQRGTAYFPLWTNGKIADMITRAGSRPAAIEKYGISEVVQAIDEMPSLPLHVTTGVLLFIYQAIFTTFTLMFGVLGFKEGKTLDDQ
jgi:hypothetical protein